MPAHGLLASRRGAGCGFRLHHHLARVQTVRSLSGSLKMGNSVFRLLLCFQAALNRASAARRHWANPRHSLLYAMRHFGDKSLPRPFTFQAAFAMPIGNICITHPIGSLKMLFRLAQRRFIRFQAAYPCPTCSARKSTRCYNAAFLVSKNHCQQESQCLAQPVSPP
ncbi:hypothetical protein [Kingella sp. (in: b-proteobacteria)]|uniref:hypothetical protein n=1 Tax=Kingella sp. (in: b-proteobacteria) TaxID=2020713 RepID=UPI0026DB47A7|nr:hypothetical protein [Kingella sp. (in: b-proteobacteria)]